MLTLHMHKWLVYSLAETLQQILNFFSRSVTLRKIVSVRAFTVLIHHNLAAFRMTFRKLSGREATRKQQTRVDLLPKLLLITAMFNHENLTTRLPRNPGLYAHKLRWHEMVEIRFDIKRDTTVAKDQLHLLPSLRSFRHQGQVTSTVIDYTVLPLVSSG